MLSHSYLVNTACTFLTILTVAVVKILLADGDI